MYFIVMIVAGYQNQMMYNVFNGRNLTISVDFVDDFVQT